MYNRIMNKLEVLHFPDKRLRKVAEPIKKVDQGVKDIIEQMFFTMYEEKGIGLAATQVNIHKRIIVIDVSEKKDEKIFLINPEILFLDEFTSAIDSKTRSNILDNLFKYFKNKSIVLVTHDSSVSKKCDNKYYLINGILKNNKFA